MFGDFYIEIFPSGMEAELFSGNISVPLEC